MNLISAKKYSRFVNLISDKKYSILYRFTVLPECYFAKTDAFLNRMFKCLPYWLLKLVVGQGYQ
jgi:hypothetical protein